MIARRIFGLPDVGWRNPFAEMENMMRRMDRLSGAFTGRPGLGFVPARVFPPLNITEDKDRYYVRAELPGIKADDIDLQVNGRNLSLSGKRQIPSEGEGVKYHRREREAGKFSRVIGLPGDIDPEKVEAKMTNGVLTVAIAKAEAAKPRQITIH